VRDDPLNRALACIVDIGAGVALLIALGAAWSYAPVYAVMLGVVILAVLVIGVFR